MKKQKSLEVHVSSVILETNGGGKGGNPTKYVVTKVVSKAEGGEVRESLEESTEAKAELRASCPLRFHIEYAICLGFTTWGVRFRKIRVTNYVYHVGLLVP
ncbi:hypothetical protein MTR_4g008370 [Medicago truncatula]|uniref:Uncharacterized protein n=1 Tax=Medicago truncatula TaxID=3880 RepID=A0A072UGR1_MEDTR|nr:hypothetical protein MTR_4g008370 [Medicago truncatula]